MKAFIHSFQGKPWNEDCEAAYRGLKTLGIECKFFTTNEELEFKESSDIVVGGMLIVGAILEELGIYPRNIDYPNSLLDFYGRKIKILNLEDLYKQPLPFFTKPVREKIAKGKVIKSLVDLKEYNMISKNEKFYCSEVKSFISEWRCFVCDKKIVGIKCYNGSDKDKCNLSIVELAVDKYSDIPRGCSLDFGVTSTGETLLIEVNDGFALGCYGLDDEAYAKLLLARWQELIETKR